MNDHLLSRRLTLFGLPFIVAIFLVTVSKHFDYTPDATYVYLQFAKNVIHGNGMSFNAGEPTYGFTSPLWLLMISLNAKLGVDLYTAAKSLDLVLAGLALIVFYLLANEVIRDAAISICATVAFSLNIWFLRWTGTGMETSLSVALLLATLLFCLRNQYSVSIICAALLAHVRPEAMFLGLFILVDLFINSNEKRLAVAKSVKLLIMYAAIVAPWFIYASTTFGTIIPNAGVASGGFDVGTAESSTPSLEFLKKLLASDGLTLAVLLVAGILLLRSMWSVDDEDSDLGFERFALFRQSFVALAWIAVVSVVDTVVGTSLVSRSLLLISPLIVIYAFWYLQRLSEISGWSRFTHSAIFVLTALVMLQNQLMYRRTIAPELQSLESGMGLCLIPIGQWLKENTPPESIVYAADIGAIGFYSERKICEGSGLVSPKILSRSPGAHANEPMMEFKMYEPPCGASYVVECSPDPDRLSNEPRIEAKYTRSFSQLGQAETQTHYYTIYKVRSSQ